MSKIPAIDAQRAQAMQARLDRKTKPQGSLGRLVEIQSSFQRYRPRLGQSAWKETPGATRVGITYNLCSHLCDQIVALLGKPEGVWATLDRQRDVVLEKTLETRSDGSTLDHATHVRDHLIPAMGRVREVADRLECVVSDEFWPLPTYQEMLFIK